MLKALVFILLALAFFVGICFAVFWLIACWASAHVQERQEQQMEFPYEYHPRDRGVHRL